MQIIFAFPFKIDYHNIYNFVNIANYKKGKMKKTRIVFLIIIIGLSCCSFTYSTRILHKDTPIFEEADCNSEIIFLLPQKAVVEKIETPLVIEDITWQKIKYGSYTGYVDSAYLYQSINSSDYEIKSIKACSTKIGEEINIYASNSTDSEIVAKIKDGAKLQEVISDVDYGNFIEINYNNSRAFVEKEFVTYGLSYNQKSALIIGVSSTLILIIVVLLIVYLKKSKNKGSEEQNK